MEELSKHIQSYFDTRNDIAEVLANRFQVQNLSRNDFHTSLGSRHGDLSFVKSGYLRVYRSTEKKEVTQWISSPGEFTTDLGPLMFNQTARWNIQALTDCELYTLPFSEYRKVQQELPEWPQIEKLFLAKCFMTIEDRIFSFISMTAEERYHFLLEFKPDLFLQVPHQYLASMLGMTPETFSRVRKKIVS
ncbi:MAG: Crp/Fnr family transcriptional regulator [bacterium]|nr:Crp/Fnr family transcriptional regulator [bacterium]